MHPDLTSTTPTQPERPEAAAGVEPALFVVLECGRPLAGGLRCSLGEADVLTLGRGPERAVTHSGRTIDLRLPSALLSSNHLRITREADGWVVTDPGSRNGSIHNRRPLTSAPLRDGDLLELGHVVLRFRTLPAATVAPPPAPPPLGFVTLMPNLAFDLRELIRLSTTALPILLLGETGTGKELIARGVHELSARPGPLVPVNCGALSSTLLDSQLFGHVKGSFTGALRDEPGFVRSSDGGTLFLDEIGDLPLPAQAALLRVLQEREVVPVGGTRAVKVDLRVVAATHRKLDLLSARGDFRADLYARLSGHIHYLTPLRERREDLGLIVADLLRRLAPDGGASLRFSADAGRELVMADWPLNVRQLEQSLTRAIALAEDGLIQQRHLLTAPPRASSEGEGNPPAGRNVDERAREGEIRALLVQHQGNVSEVARAMSCSRMQIHRWMQKYGIDPAGYRR